MPRYTLPVLGLEISFRTDADHDRIMAAKELIEERYKKLETGGSNISKEKLLTCLVLSLADDYLVADGRLRHQEAKIRRLLGGDGSQD